MKPYVFGHRGASGYEIENTIQSFKKALEMGAGIETDIQMTKDEQLICFHDPFMKVGLHHYEPNKLTYEEINQLKFKDERKIPLLREVFQNFKDEVQNFRYSFDILNRKVGLKLIQVANENELADKIEITDRRIGLLSTLRKSNKSVKLILTQIGHLAAINRKTLEIDRLRENQITTLNLKCSKNVSRIFKEIIDNDLSCYVWNVNTKKSMEKILKLNYKDKTVEAIYTDYPDKLIDLRESLLK